MNFPSESNSNMATKKFELLAKHVKSLQFVILYSFIQSIEPSSHNGMWKDEDGKNDGTDKIETTSDDTDGTLTEIADLKARET